jgi:hypothetical protein
LLRFGKSTNAQKKKKKKDKETKKQPEQQKSLEFFVYGMEKRKRKGRGWLQGRRVSKKDKMARTS